MLDAVLVPGDFSTQPGQTSLALRDAFVLGLVAVTESACMPGGPLPYKLTHSGGECVGSPCPEPTELEFLRADVIWGGFYGKQARHPSPQPPPQSEAEPGPRKFSLSHQRTPAQQPTELIHTAQVCSVQRATQLRQTGAVSGI